MRTSRLVLLALILSLTLYAQQKEPSTVRIGVLSLFHPKTLILTSMQPLTLTLDTQTINIPPNQPITIRQIPNALAVETTPFSDLTGETLTVPPAAFTLTVPSKLTRPYRGSLTVTSNNGTLIPIISIPAELAVASIVAAEAPPRAALEALKAQAVVSRSFLLAKPAAHANFDACDTTHCQFLRSPPPANSSASIATHDTVGLVLTWRPTPESPHTIVRAMYSSSCGGHTRAHPTTPGAYPFYSVSCSYCLRHPERWKRPLLPADQTPKTEQQRLAFNRVHGWSAVPSNTYSESSGVLEGRGTGHGIGLCQLGASDMAAHGANYEKILSHFFPNTTLLALK
jgi:stage II sporulation protein D